MVSPQVDNSFAKGYVRNYIIQQQLQVGGSSIVYIAVDKNTETKVAVKLLPVRNSVEKKKFLREQNITAKLSKKQYSVALYDSFIENEWGFLVMKLYPMDLFSMWSASSISSNLFKFIIKNICISIIGCHKRNIVHLDIKPENILMNNQNYPILTDYGCSRSIGSQVEVLETGTRQYRAPELVNSEEYEASPYADVWSFGVMLYALSIGTFPFEENHIITSDWSIHPKDLHDDLPSPLKDLICKTLKFEPKERISMEEIIVHPWFSSD